MHCPSCGKETPKSQAFCRHCGVVLLSGDEAPRIGPYRLDAKLGEGGMGVVYRATDEKLNREVAIKILHPNLLRQENLMERFRREARMHARMIHPNIVTLLSLYEDGEHMALVMEMVHGQNLKDYLRQNPRPPLLDVIRITEAVCAGLDAAHKLGVVHRDLKPANVLLAKDGAVKLMDFGLAKPQQGDEDLTQSGATVGSFRYMAPEQILNQPVDARTDLYALGILMYQMTTGTLPFTASSEGGGEFEIMEKQVRHMPEPPKKLNPSLPKAMSDLIMALLAKDPEDRPASCEVVRKALADIACHLERPSSDADHGWLHPPGASKNNAEIARGLLGAWTRAVLRGMKRLLGPFYHWLWEAPVGLIGRMLGADEPGRSRKPLAWIVMLLVLGVLGWGLMALIGPPEHGRKNAQTHATAQVQHGRRAAHPSSRPSPDKRKASAHRAATSSGKPPVQTAGRTKTSGTPARKRQLHPADKAHQTTKTHHAKQAASRKRQVSTHARSITFRVSHRLQRSDGSTATGGIHEFRGGHRLYFASLGRFRFKDKMRSFKSGWARLYLDQPVRISRIVIHQASVGNKSFRGGEITLETQNTRGHWTTLLTRKDRDIDQPLSLPVRNGPVKGVRLRFKSPEPITIGPVDLLP